MFDESGLESRKSTAIATEVARKSVWRFILPTPTITDRITRFNGEPSDTCGVGSMGECW